MLTGHAKAQILGNLVRTPKKKVNSKGASMCYFDIAVNRVGSFNGKRIERVDYVPVVFFGKDADNCNQQLQKGSRIFVEGELRIFSWINKQGQNRNRLQVLGKEYRFVETTISKGEGIPKEPDEEEIAGEAFPFDDEESNF